MGRGRREIPSLRRLPASAAKAPAVPAQLPGQLVPPAPGSSPQLAVRAKVGFQTATTKPWQISRPCKTSEKPFLFLRLLPNVVLMQGKVQLGGLHRGSGLHPTPSNRAEALRVKQSLTHLVQCDSLPLRGEQRSLPCQNQRQPPLSHPLECPAAGPELHTD